MIVSLLVSFYIDLRCYVFEFKYYLYLMNKDIHHQDFNINNLRIHFVNISFLTDFKPAKYFLPKFLYLFIFNRNPKFFHIKIPNSPVSSDSFREQASDSG